MTQQACQIPHPPTFCREIPCGGTGHKSPTFLEVVSRPGVLGIGLAVRRLSTSHEAFVSIRSQNKQAKPTS